MIVARLRAYGGSIRELARLAEVSPTTVFSVRDDPEANPTVGTLRKIEKALDQLEARSREEVAL